MSDGKFNVLQRNLNELGVANAFIDAAKAALNLCAVKASKERRTPIYVQDVTSYARDNLVEVGATVVTGKWPKAEKVDLLITAVGDENGKTQLALDWNAPVSRGGKAGFGLELLPGTEVEKMWLVLSGVIFSGKAEELLDERFRVMDEMQWLSDKQANLSRRAQKLADKVTALCGL